MRILTVVLLVLLAGCRSPRPDPTVNAAGSDGAVRVSLEVAGEPAVGPAEVRVYLLGSDNQAVTDATVTVTGTTTRAGAEPVVAAAAATGEGFYRTRGFTFSTAGDWLLQAEVALPDGSRAGDELSVTVPGG